jgi:ribosomal protein L11 methyltransferase
VEENILKYKVSFELDVSDLLRVESMLDEVFPTYSLLEIDESIEKWGVQIFFEEKPVLKDIQNMLPLQRLTDEPFVLSLEEIADEDWLKKSYEGFPPLTIGDQFYIYGSHIEEAPPSEFHALQLDAATAFGSGEHYTTRGCLEALLALKETITPTSILDMGCGTAILGMAAAKLYPDVTDILVVDNDPEAVTVSQFNLEKNQLNKRVAAFCGDGYNTKEVEDHKAFDLIFANILANPLCLMAEAAMKKLAVGGHLILAGLLVNQKEDVLNAHIKHGADLIYEKAYQDWQILVLTKKEESMR